MVWCLQRPAWASVLGAPSPGTVASDGGSSTPTVPPLALCGPGWVVDVQVPLLAAIPPFPQPILASFLWPCTCLALSPAPTQPPLPRWPSSQLLALTHLTQPNDSERHQLHGCITAGYPLLTPPPALPLVPAHRQSPNLGDRDVPPDPGSPL